MTLVKRILTRSFTEIDSQLEKLHHLFTTDCQKEDNSVIDLMAQKERQFDYLSFLALFSGDFDSTERKKKSTKSGKNKNKEKQYLQIRLSSFSNLSINGAPCTLCFKIDG